MASQPAREAFAHVRGPIRASSTGAAVSAQVGRPARACDRAATQAIAQVRLVDAAAQRRSKGRHVAGRDEQTGSCRNRVRHRTTRGGHDRQPTRQRLGQRHAVALVEGRRDEQVGGGVGSGEVGLAELAQQPDPVADPSGYDSGSQPPPRSR